MAASSAPPPPWADAALCRAKPLSALKVYPVNPKALDRARDRFRQSGAKDDLFDARVLGGFLRTDHAHLMALEPSSEAAQELKLLSPLAQISWRQEMTPRVQASGSGRADGVTLGVMRPTGFRVLVP